MYVGPDPLRCSFCGFYSFANSILGTRTLLKRSGGAKAAQNRQARTRRAPEPGAWSPRQPGITKSREPLTLASYVTR